MTKSMSVEIDAESEPRRRASGMWREVANVLQREIIFGRLEPREHLIEDDIMDRTNSSRHAVRRAFEEMERSGLVVQQPNRGVRVRSYTLKELEDLYEVRVVLETQAAKRIRLPAPDHLIESLSKIQTKHERAAKKGDVVQLFELNNEFHEAFFHACGNAILEEAIKTYGLLTHPIRMRHMAEKSWREEAVRQHWSMIRLLSGTKKKELVALCSEHLQATKRFYLSVNSISSQ